MKLKRLTNLKLLLLILLLILPARTNAATDNVNIIDPRPIVFSDFSHAVPVVIKDATGAVVSSFGGSSVSTTGAAHEANSQVATSTTAGTLIIARPTRVSCLIRNLDAAITVYIGAATVTAANGMPLKAGESVVVTAQTLIQVIAASGTPTVAVFDEYN